MTGFFFEEDLFEQPVNGYIPALLENHTPHYRKYAGHALCAFLDLFRPGALGWKKGNLEDPQLAESLLRLFSSFHNDEGKRQKFIHVLFDKREELRDIEKQFDERVSDTERRVLVDARTKFPQWDERIPHLHTHGVKYHGKSLLAAYKSNPQAVVRHLNRLIEE